MTDAEKAVIEAAEHMADRGAEGLTVGGKWNGVGVSDEQWSRLYRAVKALRESRKPKPKWTRTSTTSIAGPGGVVAVYCEGGSRAMESLRDRVLDLLNKADPA